MRAVIGLAALLAACSPQIDKGTYFCGPERFCPPELTCDEPSFTCEAPSLAQRFSCPLDSELAEPDDAVAEAPDAGATSCGSPLLNSRLGCIEGDDVDLVRFTYDGDCASSDPHLDLKLRFPVALAPLVLELVDEAGDVVATGEVCTPSADRTGYDHLCIVARPPGGVYFLRVRVADDSDSDCDGDCRYNQYFLDVTAVLS